ncbi:MAG: alpha/beta fold hydrolase [Paracoccaceae bacterium]
MAKFLTYQSGSIEYLERFGAAQTVMLLHGIGSNAASFTPLLEHLPDDWRVLAWNAPGYGNSSPLVAEWPVAADYADALLGLFNRLDLAAPFLIGHSLGCLIAAAFARAYPTRLSHMLLASPALGHGISVDHKLSTAAQSRIDDLALLGAEEFARKRAPRLVANPAKNPETVARVAKGMSQVKNPGYNQATHMLASGNLLNDIAATPCVTDILVGTDDIITPPEAAQKAHSVLPKNMRGTLTELPDTGHAIYQQDPTECAGVLLAIQRRITR